MLSADEKVTEVMVGDEALEMLPRFVIVRTWKIDAVVVLSTKAILVPSYEITGDVRILPPVTVVTL